MAKSGNTIGRVVGESGAANVSATGANPAVQPETEAEAKSGGGWLDALQIGLDVVGLIPGVGEVADLANAGISAARGDYVGAGLSLAAAIPFAGWGATGAKAVKRGVDIAQTGAKTAGEAGLKAGKELVEDGAEQAAKHADEAADAAKKGQDGGKVKGPRKQSLREQYLGKTPGKDSRTGREVQERMRSEGTLRDGIDGPEFKASNGKWYPIKDADMAHNMDAVKWWNETGRQYGPQSTEVRDWMLDSNNYTLDHYSLNRSSGARLADRYLPP